MHDDIIRFLQGSVARFNTIEEGAGDQSELDSKPSGSKLSHLGGNKQVSCESK